jgi:hypothetical protein
VYAPPAADHTLARLVMHPRAARLPTWRTVRPSRAQRATAAPGTRLVRPTRRDQRLSLRHRLRCLRACRTTHWPVPPPRAACSSRRVAFLTRRRRCAFLPRRRRSSTAAHPPLAPSALCVACRHPHHLHASAHV